MTAATALDARDVSVHFPGVQALAHVDLSLQLGRVHTLLGENGAGKSTLVKVLTGAQRPDTGTLRVAGEPVTFDSPQEALDRGVTAVHQELTVLPEMTVLDNVMLGHEVHHRGVLRSAEQREAATTAMERVEIGRAHV